MMKLCWTSSLFELFNSLRLVVPGADAVKLRCSAFRPLIKVATDGVIGVLVADEGSGVAIRCGWEVGGTVVHELQLWLLLPFRHINGGLSDS